MSIPDRVVSLTAIAMLGCLLVYAWWWGRRNGK